MKDTNNAAVNSHYKDPVFRMLFSDKKNLLSLYNAVNGRKYTNPEELEIVTLENAIYMGMKNDLAFIVDTNLYLYEHQSTYNPNIHCGICFTYPVNIRNWSIKSRYTYPVL